MNHSPRETITKKQCRAIARQARQHGHYQDGSSVWVRCPQCGEKVVGDWSTGARQVRTLAQELDRAMVDHLVDECREVA